MSIMAHSYLIAGGNQETRFQKALTIINQPEEKKITTLINQPDITIISEPESIKINQIRKIKKQVQLKPYQRKFKFVILKNADKLTLAAQNAFLKTLEEPPKNSIIILLSAHPEAFLATILSRVQIIRLASVNKSQLTQADIQTSFNKTKTILSASPGQRLKLAEQAAGSREQALEFLANQLYFWRNILLKKANQQQIDPSLKNPDLKQVITIIKNVQQTYNLVKRNINLRLAFDNYLLNLG